MTSMNDAEFEAMAVKVAWMLNRNWLYVDIMIKAELHVVLSKREAISVARRALELMEEKQL